MVEEEKKTAYEELKENFDRVKQYSEGLKMIQSGGYSPDLLALAIQGVADSEIEKGLKNDMIESLQKTENADNKPLLYQAIYSGQNTALKDFKKSGKDLEGIVASAPEEKLMKGIKYVNPGKVKTKKYEDIAKSHKKANEMSQMLELYQRKDTDEATRKQITENMKSVVAKHFKEKYGKNKDLLELIYAFVSYDEEFSIRKYVKIAKEEIEGFDSKIGKDLIGYLSEAVPEKQREMFYRALVDDEFEKSIGLAA